MRIKSLAVAVATLALLVPGSLSAQYAAGPDRIRRINDDAGDRVTLPDMVSRRSRTAADLGEAPADRRLEAVTLRFNMTSAQSAELNQLAADQQNPSSARYHQWLTPEQYASSFGLNAGDLAQVRAWLQAKGLTVTDVARSQTFLRTSGTVAQIEQAFGTKIHTVSAEGQLHVANLTDPTLPSALASVVKTITGLNDFRLVPHARTRFTSSISGNHFIAPADFYTVYDLNPLFAAGITGAGQTVAVAGQTDISLADVAAFRAASGLTVNAPVVKLFTPDPGISTTDLDEAQLDVEWAGATAPGATILYVNSTDVVGVSLTQIIDQNLAPIATISYGDCESNFGAPDIAVFNQLFRQATVQGQTILGPSGDSGATDCDYHSATATQGLAIDFPASSPYVTAVGGTMYNEGTGTYFGTANGSGGGSALSYIPEAIWNESVTFGTLSSGGGGPSAFFTKPSYQSGTGVPADLSRDIPDLSLGAAAGHDGYLFCSKGSCTNGFRNAANNLNVVGGTSVSTPAFAGIMALVEQKIAARVGNANPVIYGLANSTYYTNVFHDITTGNNSSPCTLGSPNCPNGGSIGYSATAGYDLASGWGSVDAFNLANDWLLATPAGLGSTLGTTTSVTTLSTPTPSVVPGTVVTLAVTVARNGGTTATPTGKVQLLVDNVAVGTPVALSGGAASFTYDTTGLSSSIHTLSAAYSGDTVYAGSKGGFFLSTAPAFTLSASTTTVTAKSGGTSSGVTFNVGPGNGYVGTVTFSASLPAGLAATPIFSVKAVAVTSTGGGSTVLTLATSQTLATGTPSAANRGHGIPWTLGGSGVAVAGLLLLVLPRRRSRWSVLVVLLASLGVLGAAGCSAGNGGPIVSNAAPGSYAIVVTASGTNGTGAAVVQTSTITLVVQ